MKIATELTRIYALSSPITADIWNTQVVRTTSGGPHQSTIWKNWSGCDGYNGELIQYSRTYVCLTDIFLFSAGCNAEQQGKLDICDGVCDAYGDAVGKLVDNEKICPKSEDVEIGKRRTALVHTYNNRISYNFFFRKMHQADVKRSLKIGITRILQNVQMELLMICHLAVKFTPSFSLSKYT